jgi:hypothetical protein
VNEHYSVKSCHGLPARLHSLSMLPLTKQEQLVLTLVIVLLLTGLAVKAYRTSHPSAALNRGSNSLQHATHQF